MERQKASAIKRLNDIYKADERVWRNHKDLIKAVRNLQYKSKHI